MAKLERTDANRTSTSYYSGWAMQARGSIAARRTCRYDDKMQEPDPCQADPEEVADVDHCAGAPAWSQGRSYQGTNARRFGIRDTLNRAANE